MRQGAAVVAHGLRLPIARPTAKLHCLQLAGPSRMARGRFGLFLFHSAPEQSSRAARYSF